MANNLISYIFFRGQKYKKKQDVCPVFSIFFQNYLKLLAVQNQTKKIKIKQNTTKNIDNGFI